MPGRRVEGLVSGFGFQWVALVSVAGAEGSKMIGLKSKSGTGASRILLLLFTPESFGEVGSKSRCMAGNIFPNPEPGNMGVVVQGAR